MATTHHVVEGSIEALAESGTAAAPPVGYTVDGSVRLLDGPGDAAEHTHPVPLEDGLLSLAKNGDLDADDRTELLVSRTDRRQLAAIRRTASGARHVWTRPLGNRQRTNVAGVRLSNGGLSIGAGAGGTARIWQEWN